MASKQYNFWWMRDTRKKAHVARLIAQGRCQFCEIILALAPNHDCTKYDWLILDE